MRFLSNVSHRDSHSTRAEVCLVTCSCEWFFLVHAHIAPATYLYPHCTELLRISGSLSLCVIFRAQLQSHCGKVPHSRHPVFSSAFLLHFFTNRGSADLLGPSGPKSLCICICIKHLERIIHVGHGTMHYISCASAYCGANCLSKMEL